MTQIYAYGKILRQNMHTVFLTGGVTYYQTRKNSQNTVEDCYENRRDKIRSLYSFQHKRQRDGIAAIQRFTA